MRVSNWARIRRGGGVGIAVFCSLMLFSGCSAISTQEERDRLEQERLSLIEERNRLQGTLAQREGAQRAAMRQLQELSGKLEQANADYDDLRRLYDEQAADTGPSDDELERFRGLDGVTAERAGADVRLTVDQAILFSSGSTAVTATGTKVLRSVARILKDNYPTGSIRVEGHTDNTPIKRVKDRFPTNWELSVARACAVVRVLIQDQEVSPEKASAVGFGQYRPVSSNATESGRAANRRVEIYVTGK